MPTIFFFISLSFLFTPFDTTKYEVFASSTKEGSKRIVLSILGRNKTFHYVHYWWEIISFLSCLCLSSFKSFAYACAYNSKLLRINFKSHSCASLRLSAFTYRRACKSSVINDIRPDERRNIVRSKCAIYGANSLHFPLTEVFSFFFVC